MLIAMIIGCLLYKKEKAPNNGKVEGYKTGNPRELICWPVLEI